MDARGVRDEITSVLDRFCGDERFRDDLTATLSRPGFALHDTGSCRGGLLTLAAYECVAGEVDDRAVRVAAATELLMAASCLFDHVMDGDHRAEAGGAPAEITRAIGVLTCANAAVVDGFAGVVHPADASAFRALQERLLESCGGQFGDIVSEGSDEISLDEALDITIRKAGALGSLVAAAGAEAAGADPMVAGLIGDLGRDLFTYLQLMDDAEDIEQDAVLGSCASGGRPAHKNTVPVVFMRNAHRDRLGVSASEPDDDSLASATLFVSLVAEGHLDRARGALRRLERRKMSVNRLTSVVELAERSGAVVLSRL